MNSEKFFAEEEEGDLPIGRLEEGEEVDKLRADSDKTMREIIALLLEEKRGVRGAL